jgi:predicted RNase H-like HicB family nuclease
MAEHIYTVLFEPAEEGGNVAFCPALQGLVTEGDTFEEAHKRVEEAIEGYLESLIKDGQPIPPDKKISLEPVKRANSYCSPRTGMNQHLPALKPAKVSGPPKAQALYAAQQGIALLSKRILTTHSCA